MRSFRNEKGFTLIELMIVVVIIGILAAIAIPRFTEVSKSAKQSEAGPILAQICTLAAADFQRNSSWPAAITDVTGWQEPGAEYFDFTFAGSDSTATATPNTDGSSAGLTTETRVCGS